MFPPVSAAVAAVVLPVRAGAPLPPPGVAGPAPAPPPLP